MFSPMSSPTSLPIEFRAKIACLCAGAVWGVFWIPLRALAETGLHSLWIMTVYFLAPACCLLPVLVFRWRRILRGGLALQITVLSSGLALALYSASIVYTDVIRAIVFFYLMPVWSMLLARMALGERITVVRMAAMGMAICGMLTMFEFSGGIPLPRNEGDWMGLLAGIVWAFVMVRLRCSEDHSSIDLTAGFFFWGLVISGGVAAALAPGHLPSLERTLPVAPLLLLFVVVLVIPGTWASLWGPKYLNPGVAGLLFMAEIVVGAVSAALLAGEPFGLREGVGVALIAGASLLEPLSALRRKPSR